MHTLRQKVVYFAVFSRVCVIFLQAVSNGVIPDHAAQGVFQRPTENIGMTTLDRIVGYLLGGFERWDAHYFLHIAQHGYVYENTVAFFPLFPLLLRFIASVLGMFMHDILNDRSLLLVSSVILNTICFVKSADVVHMLSLHILKDSCLAYKSALLFCINPASIFFSAPYSETVFSLLTFSGMYSSFEKNFAKYCAIPFGLAAATRSNGILNIGFILFNDIRNLYLSKWPILFRKKRFLDIFLLPFKLFGSLSITMQSCVIAVAPFIAFQLHCYQLFCTSVQLDLSPVIVDYGTRNGLVMPSRELKSRMSGNWCNSTLPLAYSHVQSFYWNVGFLKYYEWKQLPNFIVAAPLITIIICCSVTYLRQHTDLFLCFGFKMKVINPKKMCKDSIMAPNMFVFVVHAFFLTVFCLLFVHIQVSTRMICSSSPVPYWFAAYLLNKKFSSACSKQNVSKHQGMERVEKQVKKRLTALSEDMEECTDDERIVCESIPNRQSLWKVIILTDIPTSKIGKAILLYFLSYSVIGTVLFSNFFPWT